MFRRLFSPRAARRSVLAGLALAVTLALGGCDFDPVNPNAADDADALGTRDGLLASAVGLQRLYNVDAYAPLVLVPAVTAREIAINRTLINLEELEQGMGNLPNTNNSVGALHSSLYRVMALAQGVRQGAETVPTVEPALRSGLVALASFYRAAAIGGLAQNFTHVAVQAGPGAAFVPREQAFAQAAALLAEAEQVLTATPPNAAFNATLPQGFNLLASVRAYRARYELFAGNFQAAIDAADRVGTATSRFAYTDLAPNPIFNAFFVGTPSYAARENLGLPSVEPGDARVAIYTTPTPGGTSTPNGFPTDPLAGFFAAGRPVALPTFLPGELALIRAEALVRLGRLPEAVVQLNAVRTKTAAQDPFGVGAGLPPYAGAVTEAALLGEIYYQRAAELYLQGLRLNDQRRLGQPGPAAGNPFVRNRNFYPFPLQERINNPNTPADPPV
ncbi:MAG: RagB/SusD family nutrient uptake outer membrane protein [Rubricoccaceae bacterium]